MRPPPTGSAIQYGISPEVADPELNALFDLAWGGNRSESFGPVLRRSLAYVCAYDGPRLVGFVNVAWDGGGHAFLLDTTVHPAYQRRGIGRALVREAAGAARLRGAEWLHVDYEPHLHGFYEGCGSAPTLAGLIRLDAG